MWWNGCGPVCLCVIEVVFYNSVHEPPWGSGSQVQAEREHTPLPPWESWEEASTPPAPLPEGARTGEGRVRTEVVPGGYPCLCVNPVCVYLMSRYPGLIDLELSTRWDHSQCVRPPRLDHERDLMASGLFWSHDEPSGKRRSHFSESLSPMYLLIRGGNRYLRHDTKTIFWVTIQFITLLEFVAKFTFFFFSDRLKTLTLALWANCGALVSITLVHVTLKASACAIRLGWSERTAEWWQKEGERASEGGR